MVWIHGGAHQDGSAVEIFYDSNELPKKGVVTVTLNYRLGLFGFLSHPDLSAESEHGVSGNYGMLDQIMALKWVQENIEQFGGDPDNVTIFGESAGGESVLHLMCSPLAEGLFHKAIPQSAATGAQFVYLKKPFGIYPSAEEQGINFTKRAGNRSIEELRQMPAEELQKIVQAGAGADGNFYPVIDGYALPKAIPHTFADKEQSQVPLLIGTNEHESTLFATFLKTPLMEYNEVAGSNPFGELPSYMMEEFGDDLNRLTELYPGLSTMDQDTVIHFQGDTFFGAPTRFYAEEVAKSPEPVFLYQFRRKSPLPKQKAGAFHAAELAFVHGTKSPIIAMNEQDTPLVETIQTYWTNFAKTGNPNGAGVPNWSEFSEVAPHWMVLDTNRIESAPVELEEKYQIFMKRLNRKVELMRTSQEQEAVPAD